LPARLPGRRRAGPFGRQLELAELRTLLRLVGIITGRSAPRHPVPLLRVKATQAERETPRRFAALSTCARSPESKRIIASVRLPPAADVAVAPSQLWLATDRTHRGRIPTCGRDDRLGGRPAKGIGSGYTLFVLIGDRAGEEAGWQARPGLDRLPTRSRVIEGKTRRNRHLKSVG
jgi:hypothetical protein